MSNFLLYLFAAFAEMEREIIREGVPPGVRAAKAKGTRLGRPQIVFRRTRRDLISRRRHVAYQSIVVRSFSSATTSWPVTEIAKVNFPTSWHKSCSPTLARGGERAATRRRSGRHSST